MDSLRLACGPGFFVGFGVGMWVLRAAAAFRIVDMLAGQVPADLAVIGGLAEFAGVDDSDNLEHRIVVWRCLIGYLRKVTQPVAAVGVAALLVRKSSLPERLLLCAPVSFQWHLLAGEEPLDRLGGRLRGSGARWRGGAHHRRGAGTM